MPAQPDLPLRPMTLGELLDAAMTLLRARALPLLLTAGVLAALEQALLMPLRHAASASPPLYGPAEDDFESWWLLVAAGFATEGFIVCVLGALAAAAAGPALLGRPVRHRELWARTRPVPTLLAALALGAACGVAAFAGFVGWIVVYGFFGLVSAVIVIERSGSFLRSARLAARGGMRGVWTRLTAYLTWLAVRVVLGAGWVAIFATVTGDRPGWLDWITPVAWGAANAVAYAALGCVDAVLLLETRIRTEGLDIAVARIRSRGGDPAAALVHVP
ncbi:hypothetical protein [Couchioplanes caeruleus]|uniref:Glycerophosphoryl diester phosphodiesterase membrane domain-containing protein n=2 Tax=Couchioplanes caeruleus TaxID=56438 RepID=A0A1K0GSA9_9ACTN|nr:hypothetical protein [Couchioplanes caeruleus]OJF15334.1 hypothetical protein BG844_05170 [Couchioplanes caeruleus subsp. caeruleus]ROP29474.1 hypothetical protein EDD30_2269 [Couchioplanes caeruleus]